MMRHTTLGLLGSLWGGTLLVCFGASALAQGQGPEVVVQQVLQANPVTAPYHLVTAYRGGKVAIAGGVGSKQIHDIAIRLAIATGYPIRDDLVIDTALAHRVAALQAQAQSQSMMQAQAAGQARPGIPSLGMGSGLPYVYPPPLFGRIDDPFFGFEPPLLSYPPWYGAVVARSQASPSSPTLANSSPPSGGGPVMSAPMTGNGNGNGNAPAPGTSANPSSSAPFQVAVGSSPQAGTVEMTIDPRGNAVLRGIVPTLADRIAIGQKIAQTPGVNEVVNLLQVAAQVAQETLPPSPQPANPAAGVPLAGPATEPAGVAPPAEANANANAEGREPAIVVDGGILNDRLTQAFGRRPALAGLPIKVTVRDGIANLSGRVPTVYEAMLAYRLVEQTPGVRDVIDRLEFTVPDGERQNPLIKQGRPEDVEPYLAAQIRRNLGDLAHLDRVRVLGDTLELRGSLVHEQDRPRLDAILRSIAVLRGFRLEPHFDSE